MAQPGKSGIFFLIISFCLILTQTVAYFATPSKALEEGKYVLNILALYTLTVQWVVFIHAGGFFGNERTEKYYDLTGSITFLTTLTLSLYLIDGTISTRQIILSAFVAIWSARLGSFLFTRIHNNNGIDSRFTAIKPSRPRFLMAWTLQGTWVFITMLPVLILHQSKSNVDLGLLDKIGISFWIVGFVFEVIADYQKSAFRSIATNKEKWVSSGLWRLSRHPNYFGEILLWTGVALSAFSGLPLRLGSLFVFLSPVLVAMLLIFVSGIHLLELKADEKFGNNEAYKKYKVETPVLVPFVGRKGDARF